ncbi:soluble lytic murein transglycosylase-like protein [Micromonospora luteifusca]|uniref:Soluble lytic murein transglycosylase-like protein n=1 Tax=Micromonospora luteifusca TaxID=709860 RepID=A0ABS2LPD2_9ACTN|nr:lytic transglycosylase domain-containing protein [Micromonospora luteifusca]MBM7489817.1 soluble lytic murein transglycosylase-like protein [Micromonospora luteifusca]
MFRRTGRPGAAVLAGLLLASALVGCAAKGESPQDLTAPVAVTDAPTDAPTDEVTAEPSPSVSAVESMGAAPSRRATPTAKPTKKSTRTAPKPLAVAKPPTETNVPPAPPKPAPSSCKPSYEGTQATRAEVKAALTDAADRIYWPVSAKDIKIPLSLLKATAWQESGWQSNIYACDGGVGLMQVMPATATWMNQRFEKSYQIDDYRDNAYLGATYLAWATRYIGEMYFESDFRLDPALCTAELNSCLLNAVIAAYNFGHGAVAQEGEPLTIPNPSYVRNVRALMSECVCLEY